MRRAAIAMSGTTRDAAQAEQARELTAGAAGEGNVTYRLSPR